MKPDPTRDAAFDLLTAVLESRRSLEDALTALPDIGTRDRAAAHRLAASVLRRLGTIDAVLQTFLRSEPPAPVRIILRIGAAALLFLQTPAYAAVNTAVGLTRRRRLDAFAGLVNSVLRKVAATGADLMQDLDSVRLDTPPWLWSSWGPNARDIATAHQQEAPLDITLKPGTPVPPGGETLPTGSVRFPVGTHVEDIEGFRAGDLWVQDVAAALPARLLAPRPGDTVADLCAAPGGKTAQLAAAGAAVTAVDLNPARIERLRGNLQRWRLPAEIVTADVVTWKPDRLFDAVLLDAPCSATGTIRRHPDIPRLKRPRDVKSLVELQAALGAAVANILRPGGQLIYAVCSLQQEEGIDRVRAMAAQGGFHLHPFRPEELPGLPEAITPDGFLRTHPGLWPERGGMDGFFAARLIRQ